MGTNTGIGIGIGIPFKNNALGGDRPYLPPELKARLIGVWDNYGKKNTDADRNIIKNKIPNAGGDLEILNAAYKLNSGFGEYKEDFTSWRIYPNIEVTDNVITTNGNFNSTWFIYKHANENEINEMNIKVSGIPEGGIIRYFYIPDETATMPVSYNISEDGVYHLPKSKLSSNRVSVGFTVSSSYDWNNIRIEQLSDFGGAFVTDGINDIIISQKTLQEMGVTKDFTIVSMIHQISWRGSGSVPLTNYIRPTDNIYVRNQVADIGKTGIYGYVIYDVNNTSVNNSRIINTVLGDKNDYSIYTVGNLSQGKFSVQGYISSKGNIIETSRVAHYWTFALLGKATEDDINLIIGYFNLDRTLKADIYCNIERQGITNDNHADFNDRLIDYSGNGRDIQMYNLAWKGGSGIAAKPYETIKDYKQYEDNLYQEVIIHNEFSYTTKSKLADRYWAIQSNRKDNESLVVTIITDKDCEWICNSQLFNSEGVQEGNLKKKQNVFANTPTKVTIAGRGYFEIPEGYTTYSAASYINLPYSNGEVTVTFIPSCKGGILLDGINDFGKVTGMPIYKDYTVVTDREIFANIGAILSKNNPGAFVETAGNSVYSFGQATSGLKFISTRSISYLSKYSYCGQSIAAGAAEDVPDMWLGTIRDGDSRFFNGAIYSLMSFPYSMSKFLIERQLKKYKLGTLYPDMVEFRPIIKSNIDILKINYWDKDGNVVNVGDYVSVGNDIKTNITVPNGYKVSKVTSDAFDNITIEKSSTDFIYDVKFYGIKKSPQKIGITIEQDENYVLFNPVITSNVEYHKLDFYLNNYQKRINIGDYIPKGVYLRANFYLKNNVDELTVFTFNGVNISYRRSPYYDTAFNIGYIYNYDSPQEVNITIDEYIRYEEIVQPYPVIFQITDRNTNQRYSWGDKIKVGSSIRLSQGEKPNLLSGLYSIQNYEYEGETYSYNQLTNLNIILTKQSISLSCNKTWLLDNNEPKCILSPRLLRIPNSSYKILGHIPDISGHGNNGVIHNSAYAEMSGANGYGTNLGNWSINSANTGKIITQREEHLEYEVLSADKNILFYNTKIENDTFVIYTSVNTNIVYSKESDIIANIPANTPTKVVCPKIGTILLKTNETPTVGNIITVKQYGIYEGAYCFDGVDDFVTIPTIVGGKQVLMKVNWQNKTGLLYDQRKNGSSIDAFAILNVNSNNSIAYNSRNTDGETYIDGILNKNIVCPQLYKITHSITIINQLANKEEVISPTIGSDTTHKAYFSQMALYDFMLFDNISTDDKIKELNEYVGVEAKVELPPYYWDAYGKTNSDADRDAIQQRGIAVGDYDLTNYNHAYEGMSGYNGYPVVFGANKTWESLSGVYGYTSDVTNTTIHVTHAEHAGNGLLFSYVKKDGALVNIKEIPAFRVTIGGLEGNSKFGYRYLATEDATEETLVYLGNGTHELAKSFAPTEALLDLTRNVWVGIFITPMVEGEVVFDCDITIEVLPEYENGLAYDGITDYSKNANIPVLTDYTYIYKRTIINIPTNAATLLKGADKTNGGAFIADYGNKWQFNFGQYNIIQGIADGINWQTVNSFNGTSINKGENTDDSGITVAKFSNGYTSMVFYKLILYPKTISLLEINFLKNLMEKDEIIDLNNPIFIKNE